MRSSSTKRASGTIQVKSVNTGMEKRDNHLRPADFFDAARYPLITFKTKRVEKSGEQAFLMAEFTLRGVTKELRLPVTLSGPVKDPQRNTRHGDGAAKDYSRFLRIPTRAFREALPGSGFPGVGSNGTKGCEGVAYPTGPGVGA